MTGSGVARDKGSRIGMALFLALLTVFSVLSPIPFSHSVARGQTVATFTVDSADCAEGNFCTVSEAIAEALGSSDPVIVEVLSGVDDGVYGFFQVPEDGFPQGLTVIGIGDYPAITIRAVISDAVVWVRPNNVVTLQNLTLEQTSIERVVENNGDLTLNNVVVTGGTYGDDGGGIYNNGVLTLEAGSQVTGNTAGVFSLGSIDQENETTSGTTVSAASLLQGFTPEYDSLKRVELEFRADGGYAGSTQTVRIYPVVDGEPDLLSPLGEVQRVVSSSEIAGGGSAFIPFDFSPPLSLIPYEQYAIEWGGGSVSWYFSNTAYPPADPYDGGITWNNSGGSLTPFPERDFHFRTYWAAIDESGNGGGIFNDGGEVTIRNSTVTGNAAAGGEFGEDGRGGGVHNTSDGELTVDASTISDNTAFQFSFTETGFPNSYGGGIYNNVGIADVINNTIVTGNSANNGGGIYNLYGTLNVSDSSVTLNSAWNTGGGLVEAAPTTTNLDNVTLSDNSAYEGGGLYVDYGTLNATLTTVSGNTAEYGGGIYSEWGTVTFADGTVNGNTARSGGGIYNDFGTVGLADSTIGPDNLATNGGGGGLYSNGGSLELSNTGVDGNDAYGDGGGVYLSGGWPSYDGTMTMLGGSVSNNEAFEYECEGPCPALGGGLANYFGFAQLTQVAVTGNTVNGYGGGVSNGYNATTVISESDVSGNTVFTADSYDPGGSGGGVFSYGTLTVDSTTISGNLADFNGGGIAACDSDAVAIFNTTVSGNTAPTGGGISIDGCFYDYLQPESSDTRLNNVTVTDNTAFDSAGGIENLSAPLTLSNTIVAGNEIDNDGFFPDDCVSGIPATDGGYNLIGAGGCSLTDGINGNQVGAVATPIDPGLATLADNGGPTLTYALEAGSPAIDAGDPGNSIEPIPSTCESVDQRGVSRPQGEACDIGAFEFDEVIIPPSVGDVFLNVYTETEGSDSEPGVVEVPIVDIPIERVTGSDDLLGSAPLSSIPLSSIPLSSIDLGASPLSSIPLSSIPLSSIPLSSIPLSSIPLSSIPLSSIGGWGAILDGTIYEDEPTQNVTLKQLLALNLPGLADVNIGQLSIAGSPLSSISLPSLSLGSATLSELRTGLEPDLCTYVPGYTCNEATTTLLGLEIQGAPLSSIPLSSIPLSSIDLGATPLSSIPLSSIPLSSIPLSSIPLSSIELGTAPLSSIPLSSIDLLAAPLSSIPLSSIPLSSIPLSSIQIGDASFCDWLAAETGGVTTCTGLGLDETVDSLEDLLSDTTLSGEPLASTPLSSIPLSSIPLSSIPLSSIPLSSIALPASPLSAVPLSSIDIDGYSGFCAFIAAETGGIVTCNDSVGGDTLGDVAADLEAASLAANPLSSIPLSSIPLSSIPLSSIDLFAVEIGGAPLSSIPLSSIPLSSIDLLVDCSLVNCETATLGDADAAGAILAAATYGDLVDALSLEFLYGTGTLGDPDDLGNLALGQLLMAFLLRSDFPWETLPLEQIGAQEFSADHFVGYELSFDVGGNGPAVPAEATTIIPEGFLYVTGSGRLFADATESVVPVADPTATVEEDGTTTLAWMFAVAPGSGYSLSFDVVPSLSLGTYPASADLTIDTLPTESADATFATVTVIEADRGGEGYPTAGNDILYLGHITDATDVDYWEVQAPPPGYRVAVFLSSLSEDADLVMYRPVSAIPASPVTPRSAPLSSIPLEDDGVNYGGNATEEPETLADIDLLSSPLASISTNRDTAGESVSTVATDLDEAFTIQVSGYSGASSPDPYVLRVKTVPEVPTPVCAAREFPYTVTGSAPTIPAIPTDLNSLFVVNWERLAATEGEAEANLILERLITQGSDVAGTPGLIDQGGLGVVGGVLLVDGVNYAGWDSNPCDVNAANGIVGEISTLVNGIAQTHQSLRYVTIVGSDEVIPMGRKPDLTTIANESTYVEFFDNNALYGSFVTKHYLSDDPYGDLDPIPWLDRFLNVPDLALGRLVESSGDIVLAIENFIEYDGDLDPATADALTAGYDFLADGSQEVEAALSANFDAAPPLINETWDRTQLIAALDLGGTGQIEIGSLNAHYDHNRALPALGNLTGDETNLFTTGDITGFDLARSLYFTMGCHAGLSVADIAVGVFNDNDQDWAQTYASQGALYAANTGYGYGDTTSVALSERLMAEFAERLDGTMTVGQAMIFAKQQYFGDLGLYGAYDEKAMQEATFYGLPMYRLGTGTPAAPTLVTTTPDPVTGIQSTTVSASPVITQTLTGVGQLFSVDGDVQFTHFRPLQPIVRTDVTPTDPTLTARGAIITSLTSTDFTGVDIAYARPIIDLSANEQEVESDEMVFPTTFASVSLFNAPPGPSTIGPVAQRQQLNIIAGQFTSPADGDTFGTERVFNDYDATVYYSNSGDYTKPKLNQIQAALVGNQASFIVDVSDDVDVARVVALYRQSTTGAESTWVSVDLVEGSPWSGGGAVDPSALVNGKLDYLIQAIDSSGNVAVSTFKGLFHKAALLPPPPPSGSGIEVSGTPGTNPLWYISEVTITVTGNPIVTVDGKPATPNGSGGYIITEDGPHIVKVGEITFGVLIDRTSPEITINTPIDGAEYLQGETVLADYFCVDAGSGVVTCMGPAADGAPIDTAIAGPKTFQVDAVDDAGNSNSASVVYTVLPSSDNVCETATPTHMGTNKKDVIYGTSGDDVIFGLGGNDVLWGFGGNDIICGGPGNDRIYAGAGNDQVRGGLGNDRIWAGLQGDDILWGDEGNDRLYGESGTDELHGGLGNDALWGGVFGDDTLYGDEGNDTLYGQAGNDYLFGGVGNDKLYGGFGNDEISGEEGNDKLYGQWGNDWLDGGPNNDYIDGGPGIDTCANGETVRRCELQ